MSVWIRLIKFELIDSTKISYLYRVFDQTYISVILGSSNELKKSKFKRVFSHWLELQKNIDYNNHKSYFNLVRVQNGFT